MKFRIEFLESGVKEDCCCKQTWSGKSATNFGRKLHQLTITKKKKIACWNLQQRLLQNLTTEVSEMKGQIEGHEELAFRNKFSLSFLESIDETFSCCICKRVPPRTPLVSCQACSTVPGCQRCTDTCMVVLEGLPNPYLQDLP